MSVRRLEIRKLSIIIIVLSLFSITKLYAYDDGDFQVWNTDIEEVQLNKNLTKSLKTEIYYMLLSSKSASIWKDYNVLGTKVKVSF
ncbi:MAG: hypothetical protein Q7J37_05320 [Candidatus Omnitrophota bacterium]|nr:hypothetical protein [Candidatus Omnitrophota bacterium]